MRLPLKNNQRAQAAAELAVFGAILVFLMGTIVRTGVSSSYQQNQQLKAMRQALLKSYESSRKNEAGHNATSILYIEDRITPDIGKYGSMERVPYIMQGSGTLSNMLMYPLDLDPDFTTDKEKHIPVMDVYINGKHFAFSTAAMSPNKPLGPPPGFEISYGTPPDPRGDGTFRFQGWDFNCLPVLDSAGNTVIYGCPVFYKFMSSRAGPEEDTDRGILIPAESCDLNRNDDWTDDPPLLDEPLKTKCSSMAWFWKGVRAVQTEKDIKPDTANSQYPSFDVDNDRQEESIYGIQYAHGVATSVTVFDQQDGDLDFSRDKFSSGPETGLQSDMAIYTRTREGTYLQIKEGKTYNLDTGALVHSSTSSKDQVEIIQRAFILSKDTGRFCDGAGAPRAGTPVEACNDCFSPENIKLTCYDNKNIDAETHRVFPRLWIRSRILDKAGHFWRMDNDGGLP